MGKMELFAWACGVVRDLIDADTYGTVTIAMAAGKISSVRKEVNLKPPVDTTAKNP